MLPAVLVSIWLAFASAFVHYETLRAIWTRAPRLMRRLGPRRFVLLSVIGAFAAHALEIVLYALVYWQLDDRLGLGHVGREGALRFEEALYFSSECYASLGIGDFATMGPFRLVAGTEALTGLLMIAWTSSFSYLVMRKAWDVEKQEAPHRHHASA